MKSVKDESEKVVTKGFIRDELNNYVTKSFFKKILKDNIEELQTQRKKDMTWIDHRFNELEEKMYTKEDHNKHMILMDEMMTEVRSYRQERVLSEGQSLRMDDKLDNHEKRICALEKS